jgi:hypothetical protein
VLPLLFVSLLVTQESEVAFLRASVATIALALAAPFWLGTWLLVEGRAAVGEPVAVAATVESAEAGTEVGTGAGTEASAQAQERGRLAPVIFLALLVALLFIDLSSTGAYTDISPEDPTRGFDHPEIVDFLRSAEADAEGTFRIDSRTDIRDLWQPDSAALHGLDDVGGIANPLALSAWQRAWEEAGGRDSRRYQLFNVRYVVARDGTPLPGNFSLALDAPGDLSLFENGAAFPRAFLAREEGGLWTPDPTQPPVAWAERTAGRMVLRTAPAGPATLVLSEMAYPGWRATINGAPAAISTVNDFQRSVALPGGEAEVVLTFAPSPLRWGWIALGLGMVALVALLVVDRRALWSVSLQ